jgi:hypothetical protein
MAAANHQHPHQHQHSTTTGCFGFGGGSKNKISSSVSKKKKKNAVTTTTATVVDVDDTVLARELNDLSFQEREKVYEEVHGVAALQEETPAFMETCLLALRDEIAKLSRGRRRALDRAFFLKPTFANDRTFLVLFLRADCYDAKKAAERMAKYFTHKLELFGEDKLVKDITLDDLDQDDMECVNTGAVHILKERDRSGRYIWFIAQMHYKYKHWKNQVCTCTSWDFLVVWSVY